MPKRRSSMADSSDSALSEHSDIEFDTPQPRALAKKARTDTSPASLRPSKIIKFNYRKHWEQTPSQKKRYPATVPEGPSIGTFAPPSARVVPTAAAQMVPTTQARRIPTTPAQMIPTAEPAQADLTTKMKLVSALELSQLRENNVFLRTHNVELAKAYKKAQGQDPDGSVEAASARQAEEFANANKEIGRLTRQLAVLTQTGAGGGAGIDAAALTRRVVELEEEKKLYWECCTHFATLESQWTTERQLFVQEVTGLVARVQELQGELQEQQIKLQEEQMKARGYAGQIMAMQWGGSMRGAGDVDMYEPAEEILDPGLGRGGPGFAGPAHATYGAPSYRGGPQYLEDFNTELLPSYDAQEQATNHHRHPLAMQQQHMERDINPLVAPMEVMPAMQADPRMMGGDAMADPELAGYEEQGQLKGSGQWNLQG